jgi:hypothetical protein
MSTPATLHGYRRDVPVSRSEPPHRRLELRREVRAVLWGTNSRLSGCHHKIIRNNFLWWAREDSNLQPSGYEPLALTIELRARRRRTVSAELGPHNAV